MNCYHTYLFTITILVCCPVQLKSDVTELVHTYVGGRVAFGCGPREEEFPRDTEWKSSTGANLKTSRFKIVEMGGLSIKDVQLSDTGTYKCFHRYNKTIGLLNQVKLDVYILPDYDQQVTLWYTMPQCNQYFAENIRHKENALKNRLCTKYSATHTSNCVFNVTSECTLVNGESSSPGDEAPTHRLVVTVHQTVPPEVKQHKCSSPPICMKRNIDSTLDSNFPLVEEAATEEQQDTSADMVYVNRTVTSKNEYTCPGGFWIYSNTMIKLCIPCEPGYFSSVPSSNCTKCPNNTYTAIHAQTNCTACPDGTVTNGNGTSDPSRCKSITLPVSVSKGGSVNGGVVFGIVLSIVFSIAAIVFAMKVKKSKDKVKQPKEVLETENQKDPVKSISGEFPGNVPGNISNNAYRRAWGPVTEEPVYVEPFETESTMLLDNDHRPRIGLRFGESRETVRDFMSGLKDSDRYNSYNAKRNYNCNARVQRGSRNSSHVHADSYQYKPVREYWESQSHTKPMESNISKPERKYDCSPNNKRIEQFSGCDSYSKSTPSATWNQQNRKYNSRPNDNVGSTPSDKPLHRISSGGPNLYYSSEPFSYTQEPCRRKSISDINKHTHDENREPCKPYSYTQPDTTYNDATFHDQQNAFKRIDLVDEARYPANRDENLVNQHHSVGNRAFRNNSARNPHISNNLEKNNVNRWYSTDDHLSRNDTIKRRVSRDNSVENRVFGYNPAKQHVRRNSSAEVTAEANRVQNNPVRIKAGESTFGYHPSLLSLPRNVTQNPLKRGEDGFQQNDESKAPGNYNDARGFINVSLQEKVAIFDRHNETQSPSSPHSIHVISCPEQKASAIRNGTPKKTINTHNPYSDILPTNSRTCTYSRDTCVIQTNNNAIVSRDSPYQEDRRRYTEHVERKLSHIERNAHQKHSHILPRPVFNAKIPHQPSWQESNIVDTRPERKTVNNEETSSSSVSSSSGSSSSSSSSGSDDSSTESDSSEDSLTSTSSDSSNSSSYDSSTSQSSDTSEEEKTNAYDTVVDEINRERKTPLNCQSPQLLRPYQYRLFERPTPTPSYYSDPTTCRPRSAQQRLQYGPPACDLLAPRLGTVPSFVQSEMARPCSHNRNQNANSMYDRGRHSVRGNNTQYSERVSDKNRLQPFYRNNETRENLNENSRLHHQYRQLSEQNYNHTSQGYRELPEGHKLSPNISVLESHNRVPSRRYIGSRSLSPIKRSDLKDTCSSVVASPVSKRSSSLGPVNSRIAYNFKQHLQIKEQNDYLR